MSEESTNHSSELLDVLKAMRVRLKELYKERDFFSANATYYQRKCDDLGLDWEPIDTAPKGPKSILAYSEENQSQFIVFWHDGWRDFYSTERCKFLLTHWMPLPKPPTP